MMSKVASSSPGGVLQCLLLWYLALYAACGKSAAPFATANHYKFPPYIIAMTTMTLLLQSWF